MPVKLSAKSLAKPKPVSRRSNGPRAVVTDVVRPSGKRVRVSNRWNQLINLYLSDGTELALKAKGSIEIDSVKISHLMNVMQSKSMITVTEIKAEAPAKAK